MRTFCDNCVFFFFGPVSRFVVAAKQRFRNETMKDKTNQVPTFIAGMNARLFLRAENKPSFLPSLIKELAFVLSRVYIYMCE